MKFLNLKIELLFGVLLIIAGGLNAQPRGMDPSDMVAREKQNLYRELTDLSEDQKLLLDGIYDEYELTLKQNMDEMRRNRGSQNPENRRAKMQALRNEKDALIRDVLNENQYAIYQKQMENSFGQRGERRRQGAPQNRKDSTKEDSSNDK